MNDITIDKTGWKKWRFGDVAIQTKEIVDIENTELTRYIAGEHMISEDIHLRKWGIVGDGYLGPAFIRKFSKGDILYGSRRTYLKKVALADFNGITANTTFVIKANKELIEPILLVHLMLSDKFTEYSVQNSRGSVNPYINWKDIADYEFLLPPKSEQKRLAELLWAADEMIEKEKKELEKVLIEMKCIMCHFFQGENNMRPIKDFGNVFTGSTPSTKNDDYWNGEYLFLTPSEIVDTLQPLTPNRTVTEEGLNAGRRIQAGDVLVTCVGEIGRLAIANQTCCANQQINIISPHNKDVDSLYLYYNILHHRNILINNSTRSVVPILVKSTFEDILLPDLQSTIKKQFLSTLYVNEISIQKLNKQIKLSQQLKQELINKIF